MKASARSAILSIAFLVFISGCAATFTTEVVGPCSPEYSVSHPEAGSIFIRQTARGQAIQWGIYLNEQYKLGTSFSVRVYAGGVTIDSKNQNYEPHGSINAARALKYSGTTLEIRGTATNGGDTLSFSAKCKIA